MLREKISTEEKEMIDCYRRAYAPYNTSFDKLRHHFVDCDEVLRFWARNKETLYQLLGNQLICSKELCIKTPTGLLERELDKILDYNDFQRWYYHLAWDLFNDDYNLREKFMKIISAEFLAENRIKQETVKFTFKDEKVISAPQGSKPMKFLAKVAEHYGEMESFEQFRLQHSRVLNTKELKGTLCLSIHPLDYMTMSDNASGWSSCMSWDESGCYRRGTVEMMNSPMVLVAYLAGKNGMTMPNGKTWNNKKWRELFIVNEDIITGVKAYPYHSDELSEAVLEMITDLAKQNLNREYETETVSYVPFEDFVQNDKHYSFFYETYVMYNDLENVEHTHGRLAKDLEEGRYDYCYSYDANCMICGCFNDFPEDCDAEGILVCEECSPCFTCYECGERIYDEDDLYEVDGHYLCSYCYENSCVETVDDYEYHLENETTRVYLVGDVKGLHTDANSVRVWEVYHPDSDFMEEHFKISEFRSHYEKWQTWHYVLVDDCTPEGLELFDLDSTDLEEVEEYKLEYSLSSCDRFERRMALSQGKPWPLVKTPEEEEEERQIRNSLARAILKGFYESYAD